MTRSRSTMVILVLSAGLAILVACAPTAPGPTVRPRPSDRGRIPEVSSAPSAGCDADDPLPAGTTRLAVPTEGGVRAATVRVSAPAAAGVASPVLVSLHPFTSTGAVWEEYSGLAAAAVGRGYVVITPDGSDPGPRWAVPGGLATGVDDVAFIGAVLDNVEDRACVERNREHAAGFSAGAAMAQTLSCTMPWRFAGVAASGGANLTDPCPGAPATDVMILHGQADPIAPVTGSQVIFAPPLGVSIATVVGVDARRAGCDPTPTIDGVTPDVVVERFTGCSDAHRVEYWRLLGAGHTWAGRPDPLLELITGPTTTSISATERVLDFFDATATA